MGPLQRARLSALIAVVVLAVALPLAGATAGPGDSAVRGPGAGRVEEPVEQEAPPADNAGDGRTGDGRTGDGKTGDGKAPALLTGLGLATAARCGPELASPEGVEAQTCVLSQGEDTWARTYYRNATGSELQSVLTLMGPDGRTVQMHCSVGAGDEPGACETPREPTAGGPEGYSAVAEFAAGEAMVLRSGSNPGGDAAGGNEAAGPDS
ncbi:hypothetical protein ACIBI4_32280 [Streptomyces sp. NPDC050418]|uniref:hypothetical protein n=1 Tax=Streptomyces sp. NPDC050418 TaxID=3365612 RepID=UPI0037BADFEC